MNNNLFNLFFNLSTDPFIAKLALFLSYSFSYGLIVFVVVWAIFFSERKMYNSSLLFLSGFFSWLMSDAIKNILKIDRPFITEQITPLYHSPGFSFPSSHAAIFTSIAVAMFLINKKAGFLFLFFAILIGLSRMVIGVHYPVDVFGGFLVGLIIGLIFTQIYKKI